MLVTVPRFGIAGSQPYEHTSLSSSGFTGCISWRHPCHIVNLAADPDANSHATGHFVEAQPNSLPVECVVNHRTDLVLGASDALHSCVDALTANWTRIVTDSFAFFRRRWAAARAVAGHVQSREFKPCAHRKGARKRSCYVSQVELKRLHAISGVTFAQSPWGLIWFGSRAGSPGGMSWGERTRFSGRRQSRENAALSHLDVVGGVSD